MGHGGIAWASFWIVLKDSDPLWAETPVESYAALRSQ